MSKRYAMSFIAIALIWLVSACWQQKGTSLDRSKLQKLTEQLKDTIIHKNQSQLTSLLTADATFINLTTQETIIGQEAVVAYLTSSLETPSVKVTVDSIDFPEPKNSVERGFIELTSQLQETKRIAFKVEMANDAGSWLIQSITTVECQTAPSHYPQLKDLDWLVGSWSNHVEDSLFTSTYKWDDHKNFLIQEFALKILDYKELTGQQIIGWDPMKKSIRSWIFDSDGGFGQCDWSKDGNNWYVTAVYMLNDGRKASSTHIFAIVDANTYTFSSTDRDVEGRVLPNIGPFKATRENVGNQ